MFGTNQNISNKSKGKLNNIIKRQFLVGNGEVGMSYFRAKNISI